MTWTGCYDGQWKGLISDAAHAHPAKFSRGLIERIVRHCMESGYLKPGNVCGDPFGGVGTGGIVAAYAGLRWIGCELEPRFVSLARRNFALHQSKWKTLGLPRPVIVQGDSRKFDEIVGELSGVVASPPYAESLGSNSGIDWSKADSKWNTSINGSAARDGIGANYGSTPGQIGREKAESYWEAVSLVYSACFRALKPQGVICLVLKDYVKDKKIVPLCDQTCQLLEHLGFVQLERIHAMLTQDTIHGDLFEGETTKTKSRKSFFRRLAEKNGSPAIDFEEVLIYRKI